MTLWPCALRSLRRALHVHLGAARLRVVAVAPRQDEDAQRAAAVPDRLDAHPCPFHGSWQGSPTGSVMVLGWAAEHDRTCPLAPCEICSGPTGPWHLRYGGRVDRCRVCGHVGAP